MKKLISDKKFEYLVTALIVLYAIAFLISVIVWHKPLPYSQLVLYAGAGLGLLRYYYDSDEEKSRYLRKIPYFVVALIVVYQIVKWRQDNYLEPIAKQMMEQHQTQPK